MIHLIFDPISRHSGSTDPNVGYFSFSAEIDGGNLRKLSFIGAQNRGTINSQQNMRRTKGCALSPRVRVLAIRLLEKAAKHSEYVKGLGVEAAMSKVDRNGKRL